MSLWTYLGHIPRTIFFCFHSNRMSAGHMLPKERWHLPACRSPNCSHAPKVTLMKCEGWWVPLWGLGCFPHYCWLGDRKTMPLTWIHLPSGRHISGETASSQSYTAYFPLIVTWKINKFQHFLSRCILGLFASQHLSSLNTIIPNST